MRVTDLASFSAVRERGLAKVLPSRVRIAVGLGTCGVGNGAEGVYHALVDGVEKLGKGFLVTTTGCFGACSEEPLVNVRIPGKPLVILRRVCQDDVAAILDELAEGRINPERALCKIEEWDHVTGVIRYGEGFPEIPHWYETPFFRAQRKIVLRNCGLISPDDIEEYFAVGGYQALYKVLIDGQPELVIEQIKAARLRGRGGAGYPTGVKWEMLRKAQDAPKYLVCNADEGDPGAYMNRNEIESDPHALIEGMLIGGYVTGAGEGIVYVRAEYPLAVHRLERAIEQARHYGLLGENILGRGFRFELHLVEGAGAFVCGEETALIRSLEGKPGRPTPRPPYPVEKGLFGKPTNINNVETWYNIAPIVLKGPAWFTEIGSPRSPGTKVFSLVGKVRNTGLVEVPLGTPIKSFVYDIGGGGMNGRSIKSVQTGGPSGGCIPQEMFETPVDYETLAQLGSIMGSGGIVVMDEDNCMVDVARYFVEFTHSESCGKCVPCRVGLDKALQILNRLTRGQATEEDLHRLDELARMIRDMSLCGLGNSAPNPVLTALRHFRHEFEDHIRARRCRAGVCEDLALSPCENSCPLHMNVPRFLQLYKEDRLEDAFLSVILDNPLPASTGRVCQRHCEKRCRRAALDESVNIRDTHRYIADAMYQSSRFEATVARLEACKMPPTGKRVAVIGAGPAGLTCAYYLALLGHDVMVYDAHAEAGGMLRYALPAYRLPRQVLDRELELIRRIGVRFTFQTEVGRDLALSDLEAQYDAVFVAVGTWKDSSVAVPGVNLKGVTTALHFLEAVARGEKVSVGRRVAVVGGGNAAIDSARTALRLGAKVTVLYRRERDDMPAIPEETEAAEAEGVEIVFLAAPHRIVGSPDGAVQAIEIVKTRLGECDTSGRRRPIPTEEIRRYDCDMVILAVGETVDADFVRASGLRATPGGTVEVDRYTLQTSRDRVYAGGDVVTGAFNVANAMGFGRKAARILDERLMGASRWDELFPAFQYQMKVPSHPGHTPRREPSCLPAEARVRSFEEAVRGLTAVEALEESCRCLRCDVREGD
ncbi:MAG: FAD-dependent oxidoreductase [Bryobacterales bacterium]|nr:FAD-dependent oxidoreductase [Bryobacterales bacterium]